jgi:prevent-host-death family protein
MKTVGVYEAKTHLPRLLDEVSEGTSVVITRHGKPVARLVPIEPAKRSVEEVIESIRRNRKGVRLNGVPVKELINEGRKY